ncbi:MAG TPA: nucleotidyl transferase AbiEii/AbiGii toxin family protein [Candidatus Bilamarchaeaceae archaeon]|nr:nucleotidyl transferase AbiEii/AbiGii toxin family protein [Candidatus Bilamarchaeaceae archaeon]
MAIFEKWDWIKRNWLYVLEEADKLGLVFAGGTALNLAIFREYRASEDIDLYNPDSKGVDNPKGIAESELAAELAEQLAKKGFEIVKIEGRVIYTGPNIKIEIFNDGTLFNKIEKKTIKEVKIAVFDLPTYAEMKMSALLCRTNYDSRDLIDVFILHTGGKVKLSFPRMECEIIENQFHQRLKEIKETKKGDLYIFQTKEQVDSLPFNEFEKFKWWLSDWLSGFH